MAADVAGLATRGVRPDRHVELLALGVEREQRLIAQVDARQ